MLLNSYTSFDGHRQIVTGPLQRVALAVKRALAQDMNGPLLIFDNDSGRTIDIDTRGTEAEVMARFPVTPAPVTPAIDQTFEAEATPGEQRGRGRPKLGVTAREVTLLPRHWDWLAAQPGGASVALRKLVEAAKRSEGDKGETRKARERTYYFMAAIAGDLPGFEEASRALFAGDEAKLRSLIAAWPEDVKKHAVWLAYGNQQAA